MSFENCWLPSVNFMSVVSQSGHVKCNTIKCPVLPCENPVPEPQQCCPKCSGRFVERAVTQPAPLMFMTPCLCDVSPTDAPRIPAGLRASVRSCRYNGSVYQQGETFTKHDLFPSRQSNQCVLCTCSVSYTWFITMAFALIRHDFEWMNDFRCN